MRPSRAERYRAIFEAARTAQVFAQEALASAEDLYRDDPSAETRQDRLMRRQLAGDVFSLRTNGELARELADQIEAAMPPKGPKHRRYA